jgi:hypothetical protein
MSIAKTLGMQEQYFQGRTSNAARAIGKQEEWGSI